MTAVLNGQRRPNLSDQINRLDKILDGLAVGLNESVASAVQVAVHAAVKEATETVLRELFCGVSVLPALATALAPTTPKPPLLTRLGNACRRLWRKTVNVVKALPAMAGRAASMLKNWISCTASAARRVTVHRVTRTVASMMALGLVARRMRHFVPMALTFGVGAAALGYTGAPEIAALLHGLTVATLAVIVRLLSPMRQARPAAAAA